MAIRALLTLNGKEYEVKSFGQKFTQYVRASDNRPNFQVQFGHLEITLETPENNEVLELMLHAKHNPNVEGVLDVWTSEDMPLRRIKFSEGFIIYYKDTFNLRSKEGMTTRFVIAAWQMEINKFPMHRPQMGYSWIKKPREIKPLPEKTYAPPIPLVRKVRVEKPLRPCFFVGENITLTVTQYNISVSESDKNKVLWKTKIDDKLADFKTTKQTPFKGERISFTIPERWANKNVKLMPYLKRPSEEVFVNLRIEERLLLMFDGRKLHLFVWEESRRMRYSYSAVSGRPLEDGTFDYSSERQKLKSQGPIPEGEYYINPQNIQYSKDRGVLDKLLGMIARGSMPGGEYSWGKGRIWILPAEKSVGGVTRKGFSIHGGASPGSAGCIDLTIRDQFFFQRIEKERKHTKKIRLFVNYSNLNEDN